MNDILRIREICKENPSCDTCPLCSGPVCLVGIPPCNLNDEELYTIEKVLGYNEAIKALEQEPQTFKWCTDCKEYDQEKHCCHRWSKVIRDTVEEMKQEPKTGHWKDIPKYKDIAWQCSECERFTTMKHNYCPNCGAKMVEPQESEDA